MKKLATLMLAVMVACFGVFLTACGEGNVKDIILSQSKVVIYLGETENNTVVVNASPQNIDVNTVSIFYDNTDITVTPSAKKPDGSFDLSVSANGERGCEDVEVTVRAGADVQKTFLVSVVVPVQDVVASSEISVPFSGAETRYNLQNALTFVPETTKQVNVSFTILTENVEGKALIDGDYLVISSAFDLFSEPLRLVVQSLDKSEIRKEFSVKVVPSVRYYASEIEMVQVVGGTEAPLATNGYTLSIENGIFSEPFEILVRIPTSLGINVDVDNLFNEQTNICQYISCTKISEVVGSNLEVVFEFESLNLKTGVGNLYFNFYYANGANDNLSSRFVITETAVLDALPIKVVVPMKGVEIKTDCEQDNGGAYIIFENYNTNSTKGTAFIVNALPNNATEKEFVIETITNVDVYKWTQSTLAYVLLQEGDIITSGTTLYVAGKTQGVAKLVIKKNVADGEITSISQTLNFVVQTGASGLGFVNSEVETNGVVKKEIAVECGDAQGTTVILYAPSTTLAELKYDQGILISAKSTNYYEVRVVSNEVGTKNYTIATSNGFVVSLTVTTIQTITSANVVLENSLQDIAGVGKIKIEDGSLTSISMEYGYSLALNYEIDANAEIAQINYYFADALIGVTPYVSAYAADYVNFSKDGVVDYINYSSIVSTQNIKEANLLTAINEGKVVIKIEIVGYVVEQGQIKISSTPIEKYLCVESYRPAVDFSSTAKTIELRAKNQLVEADYNEAVAEIDLAVLASGNKKATYSNIFIDGGWFKDNTTIEYVYENDNDQGKMKYSAVLDLTTNKLTITVDSIPSGYGYGVQSIVLFAADFYLEQTCNLNGIRQDYEPIAYTIYLNIIESNPVSDINVTSLKLEKQELVTEVIESKEVQVNTKTYERVYLDISKSTSGTNLYKIVTEVLPISAFNKELKYSFVPDINYSVALVDVSNNDGSVYYSDSEGGTGYIYIVPNDPNNNSVKVIIPITVADGNSEATAFQVTNLAEIKNPNKHYVITTLSTLELNSPLFAGSAFKGGLYGKMPEGNQNATIKLNGCSLFDIVSNGAIVKDITLYGDATATGFVANENKGTIQNVVVTTYILDGVYVPSLLTAKEGAEIVGGIVGVNSGEIISCEFAGSIKKAQSSLTVNGIAGENTGAITNSIITVAKYEYVTQTAGRIILSGENYVNGIIPATGTLSGEQFTDANVISGSELGGDEYIKNVSFVQGYKAIGTQENKYGVVFYFGAYDKTEQSKLDEYNIIKISDLIYSSCPSLKVQALNMDGTNCSFVSVSGENILISGVGQFVLKVYSAHDYTKFETINMLSVYYLSEFGIYEDGKKLVNGDTFTILKGGRDIVYSQTTATVDGIKIKQNDFEIKFLIDGVDGSKYITGTGIGYHTINATWGSDTAILKIVLSSGKGSIFDALINNTFCNGSDYNFALSMKIGTTKIETSASAGSIEPKDAISFNAIITTDIVSVDGLSTTDIIDKDKTIKITNSDGVDRTDKFNINVGSAVKVENGEGKFSFEISISLKEEYRHEKAYVDQQYSIKIQAINGTEVYDAYATFKLTVLPQSLADVAVSLYNFKSQSESGNSVSSVATPTSVLKPTDSGLLVLNLFPNYATFDYVEIVATSSTMARLAYRVQKEIAPNKYIFDENAKYEALTELNGIRIQNMFANQSLSEDIGSYYIMIFATNTLNQDAVFDINVNVYYKGEKLNASTNFTLYVRMPAAPEVSIDGKTSVYAYPGETLSANVVFPEDQTLTGFDVYDVNKQKVDINVYSNHISTTGGYNYYNLDFTIPSDLEISISNVHLRLVVRSVKIDRGEHVQVESELQIYLVDFKVLDGSIAIKDANEGIFNLTSIKYAELELFLDLLAYYDEEGKNEAVDFFKENYYYQNENGFTFGSVLEELSKAEILSTYLYYVNGNQYSPVATLGADGSVKLAPNNWYKNIVSFNIKNAIYDTNGNLISDAKLQVKGGESTGEVPMMLQIYYSMPNGATYVYVYNFTFVNALYTTEDMPIEITNGNTLLEIAEEETAYDYILANDIYLYNFETINDTSKIKSLDGNNYTIHIVSFASPTQNSANFALFNTVSSDTTIKNLTVNYYYLNEISLADEVTEVKMAGFAITNNGIITNCEVMAFAGKEKSPTFTTYGLKLSTSEKSTANINIAGFVLNNIGSITNSRVGGDQKVYTTFDYFEQENPTLIENTLPAYMFTIRAQGTVTGFCYSNTGVIASSFAKNVAIINTYNKNETKITAGFVNSNEGTITMSYVEGVKQTGEVQALGGGIEATGIMAGFAYSNIASITDCYSNIMIHTPNNQVGRLGAGFVYYNAPTGTITASYSFSSIAGNNTTQLNFAGITDLMEYNNLGTIKNCYYYITDEMESISIEGMFNTDINTVKQVSDPLNFYGFSFSSLYSQELDATWTSTNEGPTLTSANDIAHSVRYKVNNPSAVDSSLEYIYVYEDKYDLGTANNPIIIRTAQEFNSVLGGSSTSREIQDNFYTTTKKVFGSYRLVNSIDLTELIIDDKEESDYKYNLASTQMTLTGEYKSLSNRAGSFNGNGLTITNLAISNSETAGTTDYGMFKTIENGASFSNVNIVLAKGGVKADNTINVGVVAGTLADSSLINVHITTNSEEDHTDIVGSHIVGGVVGRVIKNSYVFGISVTNISVIATYYQDENVTGLDLKNNTYERDESNLKSLSIAGGGFGVVDIYTQSQLAQNDNRIEDDISFANVQNVTTTGGMTISGMTVGGVMGYTGKFVIAKDIALVITNSVKEAKLIAYNCFAGGIVGYNMGFLYQIRAEHEKTWQNSIESNISSYYTSVDKNTRDAISTGNKNLFQTNEGEVTYKPVAIGGLVGVMENGIISIAYSKINVKNEYAKYAGGAVGLINRNITPTGNAAEVEYVAQLLQVYTTGDVYAGGQGRASSGGIKSYTGGVIGLNRKATLVLNKVNALNMWSVETLQSLSNTSTYKLNQIAQNSDEGTSLTVEDISVFTYDTNIADTNYIYSAIFQTGENYNIVPMRDGDNGLIIPTDGYTTITPYYSYKGVEVDNGAQIDSAFINNGWYDTSNWARDNNEVYPHIKFTVPTSIYDIWSKNDFWKFSAYGSNPEAVFIVRTEGLIDCTGHQTTYSLLRGTIKGMYDTSGFEALSVPLFRTASNATIMNLDFKACSAPIVESAEGITKFSHLYYDACNFSEAQTKQVSGSEIKVDNYAGIAYEVKPFGVTFNVITFNNCSLGISSLSTDIANQNNINAGFLFAQTIATANKDAKINISGIQVQGKNYAVNNKSLAKDSSLGLLFGKSEVAIILQNISIDNKINANIKTIDSETVYTASVGLIGGYINNEITIKEISTEPTAKITVKTTEDSTTSNNQIVSVGGLIGTAKTINLSNVVMEEEEGQTSIQTEYSAAALDIKGCQETTYAGGIVGKINDELTYTLQKKNVIVGANTEGTTQMVVQTTKNAYVGGVVGYANKVTGINNTSHIAYNGDIIIEQTAGVDGYMYVGGIIGQLVSNTTSTLQNALFGGTINFATSSGASETNISHYVGGLIGSVEAGHTANLENTFAVGDISLNGKAGNLTTNQDCYVAGLIGEVKTNAYATLNNVVSLTTIYNLHKVSGGKEKIKAEIDAIAIEGTNNSVTASGKGAVYASNINLCVSSISSVNNTTYTNATDSTITTTAAITSGAKQVYANENASKLNPIIYSNYVSTSELAPDFNVTDEVLNGVNIHTFTSNNDYRKIYVRVLNTINELEHRINLENAFVFGDGGVLYSKITPFGTIDSASVVSGIISRVDITDSDTTDSRGGFANKNEGVIYTSSAQETLIHFQNTSDPSIKTKFYGYLNANKKNSMIGGFVAENTGYIFGSNANMQINLITSNVSIAGFAGSNKGTIDYSYASGYTTNSDTGTYKSLELFATNNSALDTEPTVTNCYTIFGNLANSASLNLTVTPNVAYEEDAVETTSANISGGTKKTIYNSTSWLSGNKYYAVDQSSNSYYPTISNGAFDVPELKYLKRNTAVYQSQNIIKNSGLVTQIIYFTDVYAEESPIYNVMPNITAFKKVAFGNNYVLSRSLNLGYTGEAYTAPLIGEFNNGVINGYSYTVNNGTFENTNAITKLGEGATFTKFGIKDTKLTGSSTGFIGESYGKILNCEIMGTIEITVTKNAGSSIGILAGTNSGEVDNILSTAQVKALESTVNYNFGTVVGNNASGGIVKNVEIVTAEIVVIESKEIDIVIGGVVGTAGADSEITDCGIIETHVFAASAAKTYLGGVVGTVSGSNAIITNCYADFYEEQGTATTTITGGIEETTDSVQSGKETITTGFITQESYVGGIIGYVNGGVTDVAIKDCANSASVTAKARWYALSGYDESYKYVEELNSIYIYRYMDSKAYAGGICSNYISSSNSAEDNNDTTSKVTRLANYGEVSGGFKAWKPVGAMAGNSNGSFGMMVGHGLTGLVGTAGNIWIGTMIKSAAPVMAKTALNVIAKYSVKVAASSLAKTATSWIPYIGWAITIALTIKEIIEYFVEKAELEKITLNVAQVNGNSGHTVGTVEATGESNLLITPSKLDDILSRYNSITGEDYRSAFTGQYQKDIYGTTIHITEFTSVTNEPSVDYGYVESADYGGELAYEYYSDSIVVASASSSTQLSSKYGKILTDRHYDCISPDLSTGKYNFYSKTKDVASWTSDLQGEFITLKTANDSNKVLQFRSTADYNVNAITNKHTLSTINSAWGDNWDNGGQLSTSTPDPLEFDVVEENGQTYYDITITDPTAWRNLVYTINSGTVIKYKSDGTIDEISTPTDNPFIGNNVRVTIDIGGENKDIKIGSSVLNEFNGLLTVKSDTKFKDMTLYINNTTVNAGLIGYSDSAILNNVKISGALYVENDITEQEMKYANFGMLIGTVGNGGTGVTINNSSVSLSEAMFENYAFVKFGSFGGVVGASTGNLILNGVNVSLLAEIYANDGSIKHQTSIDAYGVGGVIGKITSGNVEMYGPKVYIEALGLVGDVNNAGGLVGYNNGNLTVNTASVDAVNLMVASTGDTTSVGGLVGYNSNMFTLVGDVDVNSGVIGSTISADVLNGLNQAYAGGIIGYATSNSYVLSGANIRMGVEGLGAGGYNNLSYIVAGTNAYSLTNGLCAIPTYAKAGKIIGNINVSMGECYSTAVKYVAIDNTFNADTFTASAQTSFDIGKYYNCSDNTIAFDNSIGKTDSELYYKNSISYEIQERSYYNDKTDTNDVVYEYYLKYIMINKSNIVTNVDFDADDLVYELSKLDLDVTYSYLIRISKANAELNNTNMYLLQVILLNGKEFVDLQKAYTGSTELSIAGEDYTEPEVVYSFRFSASANDLALTVDGLDSMNAMAVAIKAMNTTVVSGKTEVVEEEINSTKTEFVVNDGKISLVETLNLITTTSSSNEDKSEMTRSTVATDVKRTIFSLELPQDTYTYTTEVITDDLRDMVNGNSTFSLTEGTTVTGEYVEDIVYNGYIIPYSEIRYNDKAVISANKYTKTVNNQNIEIISLVMGDGALNATSGKYSSYQVAEFVFKNIGGKLYYIGKMSYNLTSGAYDKIDFANRYESFMPVYNQSGDLKTGIYNIDYVLGQSLTDYTLPGFTVSRSGVVLQNKQIKLTHTDYRLGLTSGKLVVQSSETEQTDTIQPLKVEATKTSGSFGTITCDEYYSYAGKVLGYKVGTQYFYYNYYNGAYSSASNGTATLSFYDCSLNI